MRLFSTVFALLLALSGVASAKGGAHAKQLYNQGEAAFLAGNYSEAIGLFEQAFAESKRPALLWNIALAHRRQYEIDKDVTHLRKARDVYDNFAALSSDPKSQEDARKEAAAVDGLIKEVEAGRQVKAAEGVAEKAPEPLVFEAVGDPDDPMKAAPPKKPDARDDLVVAPIGDLPAAAPAKEPASPIYKKWWLWTAVGVVLVGAGVATAVALSGPKDATAPSVSGGVWTPTF